MCRCPDRQRQRGASLIEFAFVLPLLLFLLIGTLYFGYVFVLQSAATHAAQQAAVAATSVDPVGNVDYAATVETVVAQTVLQSLEWLPDSINGGITSEGFVCNAGDADAPVQCQSELTGSQLAVTVVVNVSGGSSPLLPRINLPPFGQVPPAGLTTVTGVAKVTL